MITSYQLLIYALALIPACVVGYVVFWAQTQGKRKKFIRPEKRKKE
jgi:hypothetical protein